MVHLLESNFPFKYLKITQFLVLKDLRKLNTATKFIRLHIELISILRLRALSKDLELLIAALPMK